MVPPPNEEELIENLTLLNNLHLEKMPHVSQRDHSLYLVNPKIATNFAVNNHEDGCHMFTRATVLSAF